MYTKQEVEMWNLAHIAETWRKVGKTCQDLPFPLRMAYLAKDTVFMKAPDSISKFLASSDFLVSKLEPKLSAVSTKISISLSCLIAPYWWNVWTVTAWRPWTNIGSGVLAFV